MTEHKPGQFSEQRQERYADDEIDLFELFEDILSKWRWVVGAGFICTLAALIYAVTATPTYQTEVVYSPTNDSDLYQLNQPKLREALGLIKTETNPNTGAKMHVVEDLITAEDAYNEFRRKSRSGSYIREFYEQLLEENDPEVINLIYNEKITPEQNTLKFSDLFSLEDPKKGTQDIYFKLKLEFKDANLAAKILNNYSEFINQLYIDEKKATVESRIQAQLAQWHIEAEDLRSDYLANKTQRLLDLKEATAVARSINQQRPLYDGERIALGVEPPLYMMGFKALEAEIKQIEQRSQGNEDAYIKGLPELLSKISRAENAQIEWHKVNFIDVDQNAVVPLSPIKPKKKLIVAIGMVAGGMLGIMLAIMVAAFERRKKVAAA